MLNVVAPFVSETTCPMNSLIFICFIFLIQLLSFNCINVASNYLASYAKRDREEKKENRIWFQNFWDIFSDLKTH